MMIAIVVITTITLPIIYRFLTIVNGRPPYLVPMIFAYGVFALVPASQLITAILIRLGRHPRGRMYCITTRGLSGQGNSGFSWKNAICFDVQADPADSLSLICIYRKSGLVTRVRLPFEPERSNVLKAIERFVPERNSSHQIEIRMQEEDIPNWKRWSFIILAIAAGVILGLYARDIKEVFAGSNYKGLKVFLFLMLPTMPLILWTLALFSMTPRFQRRALIGWLILSSNIAIFAFFIAAIAPEVSADLETHFNQTSTTQSSGSLGHSP